MTTLLHTLNLLSAAWAATSEIITAGAILWSLNSLANLIRFTYQAGCAAGRALWPAIHAITRALRWAIAEIDWRMVATIVLHGLVATVVLVWTATIWIRRQVLTLSERIGRIYAALLVKQQHNLQLSPMVHPLAEIASELDALTCKELRKIVGVKRNVRKAHLIAYAIA